MGLPKMEPVLKRDEFCPGHLWLAWDLWGSKENNTSPSICRILIPRETKKYAAASSEQWQYHGIVWRLVFNFDWSIRLWNTATSPPLPPLVQLQSTTCNPYFPQIPKPDSKFHDTNISCWSPPPHLPTPTPTPPKMSCMHGLIFGNNVVMFHANCGQSPITWYFQQQSLCTQFWAARFDALDCAKSLLLCLCFCPPPLPHYPHSGLLPLCNNQPLFLCFH